MWYVRESRKFEVKSRDLLSPSHSATPNPKIFSGFAKKCQKLSLEVHVSLQFLGVDGHFCIKYADRDSW